MISSRESILKENLENEEYVDSIDLYGIIVNLITIISIVLSLLINLDIISFKSLTQKSNLEWTSLSPFDPKIYGHPTFTVLHLFGTDSRGSALIFNILYGIGNTWFLYTTFLICSFITFSILYLLSYVLPFLDIIVYKINDYTNALNILTTINISIALFAQDNKQIYKFFIFLYSFLGGTRLYEYFIEENGKLKTSIIDNSFYLGVPLTRLIHYEFFSILFVAINKMLLLSLKFYFLIESNLVLTNSKRIFKLIHISFFTSTQYLFRENFKNANIVCILLVSFAYIMYWYKIYSYYEQEA